MRNKNVPGRVIWLLIWNNHNNIKAKWKVMVKTSIMHTSQVSVCFCDLWMSLCFCLCFCACLSVCIKSLCDWVSVHLLFVINCMCACVHASRVCVCMCLWMSICICKYVYVTFSVLDHTRQLLFLWATIFSLILIFEVCNGEALKLGFQVWLYGYQQ